MNGCFACPKCIPNVHKGQDSETDSPEVELKMLEVAVWVQGIKLRFSGGTSSGSKICCTDGL